MPYPPALDKTLSKHLLQAPSMQSNMP